MKKIVYSKTSPLLHHFFLLSFLLTCFFSCYPLTAEQQINQADIISIFNKNITSDELNKLSSGEVLIRNIGNAKKISLNPVNVLAKDTINTIKNLKPAYLAEIIQIRPVIGNENLITQLDEALLDVPSYVDIPYYSVRQQKTYSLYSSAEIITCSSNNDKTDLSVIIDMNPFGKIDSAITSTIISQDNYSYLMINTSPIDYSGFTCAKTENMKSIVIVFRYENYYVLYGIGGVNAPSIFFLRDRIETSFINRIQSFCSYFFNLIK